MRVLLVEDNPGDARLVVEAFRDAAIEATVTAVPTPDAAMAELRTAAGKVRPERPDLILLDLNFPGRDGRTFLDELQADARISDIPVVILSGSGENLDVLRAFVFGVLDFVRKPITPELLRRVVDQLPISPDGDPAMTAAAGFGPGPSTG